MKRPFLQMKRPFSPVASLSPVASHPTRMIRVAGSTSRREAAGTPRPGSRFPCPLQIHCHRAFRSRDHLKRSVAAAKLPDAAPGASTGSSATLLNANGDRVLDFLAVDPQGPEGRKALQLDVQGSGRPRRALFWAQPSTAPAPSFSRATGRRVRPRKALSFSRATERRVGPRSLPRPLSRRRLRPSSPPTTAIAGAPAAPCCGSSGPFASPRCGARLA